METIIFWFKVIRQSVIEILPLREIRNKIMDLVIIFILSVLTSNELLQRNEFSAFSYGWNWAVFYLVVFIIFRFVWGILSIPARQYLELEKQDRWSWRGIGIKKSDFKIYKEFRGYVIDFVNNKPIRLGVFVQIPYFELDETPDDESTDSVMKPDPDRRRFRRLSWQPDWATRVELVEDSGRATCNLLDSIKAGNETKYQISYFVYSEDERKWDRHALRVNQHIRGELKLCAGRGTYDGVQWLDDLICHFEIKIRNGKKPTIELSRGSLKHRLPKTEKNAQENQKAKSIPEG